MPARSPPTSTRRRRGVKPLTRYQAKRDFSKTPEPSGNPPRTSKMAAAGKPRTSAYCVQKHLASHLHYDFRLEYNGIMLSWAVPRGPSLRPGDKRLAMRVEDHPFDYRTFEGVIPSGYGAGVVMLWDEGNWQPEEGSENIAAALRKGELKFRLHGAKLKGSWVLVRTGAATPTGEREKWLLMKHRDDWSGDVDVTTAAPRSVKSDLDFTGIMKKNPDVWDSHKPGDPTSQHAELEKIVEKVVALEGAGAPATRAAPRRPDAKGGAKKARSTAPSTRRKT